MAKERDEHNQRLARITEQLASLRTVSASAHEEVLVATEQLITHALTAHDQVLTASRLARTSRVHERADHRSPKRRIPR